MVIMHVLSPAPAITLDESILTGRESAARDAQRVLSDLEAEAAKSQVKVETALADGDAADRILEAARNADADILAIAVQRKRAVEAALLGATAERLVREADAPVLSIPEDLSAKMGERTRA
jgi:nucleotide-binding universal stress UspA family protein